MTLAIKVTVRIEGRGHLPQRIPLPSEYRDALQDGLLVRTGHHMNAILRDGEAIGVEDCNRKSPGLQSTSFWDHIICNCDGG